ncbi:MAG: DUF1559 domain-containing protein [Fimbriiglobus sp.]
MVSRRNAFTLIELLVVIAIIAVLIGLLLPAVQKVREAAARTQSLNNLKQIGLATHMFHDANNRFPASNYAVAAGGSASSSGTYARLYSAFTDILPYIEQEAISKRWNANLSSTDATDADGDGWSNLSLGQQPVKTFIAPAMPAPSPDPGPGWSSYAFSAGNRFVDPAVHLYASRSDGIVVPAIHGQVTLTGVTDGTSNTILAGEMHWTMRGWTYTSGPLTGQPRTGRTFWANGHPFVSWTWTNTPMNTHDEPAVAPTGSDWWKRALYSFRSVHTQGVHFVFADGSTRLVRQSIPHDIYQALGSRNGGEVIPAID